jgi:hypothetical protein
MGAAIYEDLLNTGIGEKFEGVLDEWGVREGQQTLSGCQHGRL